LRLYLAKSFFPCAQQVAHVLRMRVAMAPDTKGSAHLRIRHVGVRFSRLLRSRARNERQSDAKRSLMQELFRGSRHLPQRKHKSSLS